MKRDYPISVAMATYNGEKYIKEQLDSILKQLNNNDEIIISDDESTDKTINIIKEYNDSRIKLLEGPKLGVKQNFANAIKNCSGKYIFLADQDDIWFDGKVKEVLSVFEENKNCVCITHDCAVVDSNLNLMIDSFFEYRKSRAGIMANIYKNRYLGCCMAFRSDIRKYILPIPNDIEMHDQWIGIISEKHGKSIFLKKKLMCYRRHGNNASSMHHYGLIKMIRNRSVLTRKLIGR